MVEPSEETEQALERVPDEEYARRMVILGEMEAIRNQAIAEGMELWSLDRVNEEVHRRRYSDRD